MTNFLPGSVTKIYESSEGGSQRYWANILTYRKLVLSQEPLELRKIRPRRDDCVRLVLSPQKVGGVCQNGIILRNNE